MSEAYLGEIRIFAGNFPPRGWAFCNGQLMSIQQFPALFSILSTQYGGDGRTTFALPNLSDKAPMHQGIGPGLTERKVGKAVGNETVTLITSQMPIHSHAPMAINSPGLSNDPNNGYWATSVGEGKQLIPKYPLFSGNNADVQMNAQAINPTGGSQPHNNMQPYLALNFIICIEYGEFPARD
ncbi:MAG TPA: phage tail protein [Bacillus bacterium]|nr:phage tail protein [Bacillus sp. (in: firmicutes)]